MTHTYAHDFDPHACRTGYLPGSDYALPYLSQFSTAAANPEDLVMLRHVNCSFLSTPGVPPTLLALKQHAQSLTYLISMLDPHGRDDEAIEVLLGRAEGGGGGTANGARSQNGQTNGLLAAASKKSGPSNNQGEALLPRLVAGPQGTISSAASTAAAAVPLATPFDWLDLRAPYANDADPDHHRPLRDLLNQVRARHDVLGTTYRCPLETYRARNAGPYNRGGSKSSAKGKDKGDSGRENGADGESEVLVRPYAASHHALLMHANLCLERLDHEYATSGGLLSLLPTGVIGQEEETTPEKESATLAAARNSLVGQWLVFTQQLAGRAHELEISYANAVQALAGEMVLAPLLRAEAGAVEAEIAGRASDDPPPTAPQQRWILANAGYDVWAAVHDLLDKAAAEDAAQAARWRRQGVMGERGVAADGVGAASGTLGAAAAIDTARTANRLVHVDVTARFYRPVTLAEEDGGSVSVASAPRGPIFVCPAWGGAGAAEALPRPSAAAAPAFLAGAAAADGAAAASPRMSASALERRYDARLRAAARLQRDHASLQTKVAKHAAAVRFLRGDRTRVRALNAALEQAVEAERQKAAAAQAEAVAQVEAAAAQVEAATQAEAVAMAAAQAAPADEVMADVSEESEASPV